MPEDDISTEGPTHIYCSVQLNILDFHGKGQGLEFTIKQSF